MSAAAKRTLWWLSAIPDPSAEGAGLSGKEAPAGPMTATGIHLLDLSIGVFGEADTVHASVKQLGSPLSNGDTLAALVTFKKGGHESYFFIYVALVLVMSFIVALRLRELRWPAEPAGQRGGQAVHSAEDVDDDGVTDRGSHAGDLPRTCPAHA